VELEVNKNQGESKVLVESYELDKPCFDRTLEDYVPD
jgi:hypothetical protein